MEIVYATSLKMLILLLGLLVFVQSARVTSSVLLEDGVSCGTYHVSHSDDSSHALFFIDGKVVNRFVFCESLNDDDNGKHCLLKKHIQYCKLDVTLEKLYLQSGRKYLKTIEKGGSVGHDGDKMSEEDKPSKKSQFHPKTLAMALPAFFILCCAFVCPCFQARKRDAGHAVLSKELNSMDSISSLEMHPVVEKLPGSPVRVPPSPLRVSCSPSRFSMSPKLNRLGSVHLNMNQVARATQNFSPTLLIGEGGFGSVYKAELPDGQIVAIKRARREQFEALRTEFRSEVELMAKIDHRHLVRLLGYVEKGNERLIITEFMPNGTLRDHLDGLKGKILDFNQRLEISIDVGHGLTYLHLYAEHNIIHRDVKSSNILLTESFRAKVADFGFARLADDCEITHEVKGTFGYLDPEYQRTRQLTNKTDVYSFGILLLEILTGRIPLDLKKSPEETVTIRWAFKKYNEGKFKEMLDPLMSEKVDEDILEKIFGLAIQCAAPTRADRPDMKEVAEQLWRIRMDYLRSEIR